jgi:hypothetical protein
LRAPRPGRADCCEEVEIDLLLPIIVVELHGTWSADLSADVGDQDVNPSELRERAVAEGLYLVTVGHVGSDDGEGAVGRGGPGADEHLCAGINQ